MADVYRVLAQATTATTAVSDFYTCGTTKMAIISKMFVANSSTTLVNTFGVLVAIAGAATTNAQYIARNIPIGVGEALTVGEGLTLSSTDKVRIVTFDTTGNLSFTLCGVEKDI